MNETPQRELKTRRSFFSSIAATVATELGLGEVWPRFQGKRRAGATAAGKTPTVIVHQEAVARSNKGVKNG